MMTEELRQIMAGPIESFTPGETVFKSADGSHSARVYQTISRDKMQCIVKLVEGYDMARCLNTIRAKHSRKGVVKFNLRPGSDYIIGFYTNFADSCVERAEFHRTPTTYECIDDSVKTIRGETTIDPIEIKNSRCQLSVYWNENRNNYCDMQVVIYLKKSLPDIRDSALIALDEVMIKREKYIVRDTESDGFEIKDISALMRDCEL